MQAVALAHAHGWRVVGFSPPYASESYDLLAHDPRYATLWSMFVHRAPQLFARYGYPFLDLSDGRKLSACTDDTFVFQDGARIPARPARCRSGGPSMRRPPSCRRRGSASPS